MSSQRIVDTNRWLCLALNTEARIHTQTKYSSNGFRQYVFECFISKLNAKVLTIAKTTDKT